MMTTPYMSPSEQNLLELFQLMEDREALSKIDAAYEANISIRSLERIVTRIKRNQTPLVWYMDVMGIEYLKGDMDGKMYFVKG